jgi:hypothetical protein
MLGAVEAGVRLPHMSKTHTSWHLLFERKLLTSSRAVRATLASSDAVPAPTSNSDK